MTGRKLGLDDVIEVANYAEAAGILLALRQGLDVRSFARPLATLRPARPAALHSPLRRAETTPEEIEAAASAAAAR